MLEPPNQPDTEMDAKGLDPLRPVGRRSRKKMLVHGVLTLNRAWGARQPGPGKRGNPDSRMSNLSQHRKGAGKG